MYIPPGFGTLFPYFFVRDAKRFVLFLVTGLGGEEISRQLRPDGTIANAHVRFNTSTVMVSEASETFPPMAGSYYLYVDSADDAIERAVKAGAELLAAAQDMPYGDRQGGVRDTHGNIWWLSQRLQAGPYAANAL